MKTKLMLSVAVLGTLVAGGASADNFRKLTEREIRQAQSSGFNVAAYSNALDAYNKANAAENTAQAALQKAQTSYNAAKNALASAQSAYDTAKTATDTAQTNLTNIEKTMNM